MIITYSDLIQAGIFIIVLIESWRPQFKLHNTPYLRKISNYVKKLFWEERTFLIDGYFACSIGNVSEERL